MYKSKAEWAAEAWVRDFHQSMKDPVMRGPRFDPATFDIEEHVDMQLFLSYSSWGEKHRHPKKAVRQRALKLARRLWNELWEIQGEQK